MQVKIESAARELRPLRGAAPGGPLYTGIKVNGQWYNIEGDHRNLYNKSVDLLFEGNIAKFAQPQQPPAQPQTPPKMPPPPTNGHTPHWPNRESAVEAYLFYVSRVGEYVQDQTAIVRAANCLTMRKSNGKTNRVHRDPDDKSGGIPF